jgi:hypothetical protein
VHGYHECLQRLGKTAAAAIVSPRLRLAVAGATVPTPRRASAAARRCPPEG